MAASANEGSDNATKAAALECITRIIDACPFPAIANDWEMPEIKCVAMNQHYVDHKRCPKDRLLGKNNRVLDPTHQTSLPGKVRLDLRAAFAFGSHYDRDFVSVKTDDPGRKFTKSIGVRTMTLGDHRFVIGVQRTRGDLKAEGTFQGDPVYAGTTKEWWEKIESLMRDFAPAVGLEPSWISEQEASRWHTAIRGTFKQTDTRCRKEQLDGVMKELVANLAQPVLLLDPFLPDCPVIAVNKAAQALTGWSEIDLNIAECCQRMSEDDSLLAGGAYHINYGLYTREDQGERIAVRTACSNGRPCAAAFRDMYKSRDEPPVPMWLQGVTLAVGVDEGPLSGGDVWYLIALLGDASSPGEEDCASSIQPDGEWNVVSMHMEALLKDSELKDKLNAVQPLASPHPYGGEIKLLDDALWHAALPLPGQ